MVNLPKKKQKVSLASKIIFAISRCQGIHANALWLGLRVGRGRLFKMLKELKNKGIIFSDDTGGLFLDRQSLNAHVKEYPTQG